MATAEPGHHAMLVLPVPLVAALVLAFLLLHTMRTGSGSRPFAPLLAASIVQAVIVALVQHYGIAALRPVQPVTATLIPPLAWLTFQATAVRPLAAPRDLPHLGVPLFTAFCIAVVPEALDVVVPAVFLGYGVALATALRAGADGRPRTRLETGYRPGLVWSLIALALLLSAVSDGVVAVAQYFGAEALKPWILSVSTSLSLGLIGVLGLSRSVSGAAPAPMPAGPPDPEEARQDADILERLEALLEDDALYMDAELTLERLSRRLRVPAKALSRAVNRRTGGNVSRYVNAFRVRRACDRLRDGDSVTAAMFGSGFNTKSNFNREFKRITGVSPTAWRGGAEAGDGAG